VVGCRSAHDAGCISADIEKSLERQVTVEEAQSIVRSYFDASIQVSRARSVTNAESRDSLLILEGVQQRGFSKLETLLSHKKDSDELWTYMTVGPRGRESGFALVRGGHVVE